MMKNRKLLIAFVMLIACMANAQRIDKQEILVAVTEQEMYKLYDQMLDSARVSNRFLSPSGGRKDDYFSFGYFKEIESKDTLMKFVQRCDWKSTDKYICDRFYRSYISNTMSIAFYERFLDYLKQLDKIENFYIKSDINLPLVPIKNILIAQYESGKLNKQDSANARQLIEETLLRLVNDDHNYRVILYGNDKYMTDNIRQALVNIIENPFYPAEYLDFYMSQQDTLHLDTIGIPANIDIRWKAQFTPEEREIYERDLPLYEKMKKYLRYAEMGKTKYNGLSAGQAYLQEKRDKFLEKGYLPINYIAKYAYEKNDELLIKHLKEFKKKHPDYPLEHF